MVIIHQRQVALRRQGTGFLVGHGNGIRLIRSGSQDRLLHFLHRLTAIGVRVLCLEVDQIPGRRAGQVFLDGVVDVIPFGEAVKVLDAGFLNLHIGHAAVLPHQPLHGLLTL